MLHRSSIPTPAEWRQQRGCTLKFCADYAEIGGKNPGQTYARYERGENPCPAGVVEAIRELSDGAVGAESWQRARREYCGVRERSGKTQAQWAAE